MSESQHQETNTPAAEWRVKGPTQRAVVLNLLQNSSWCTMRELSVLSGFSQGSVSSRIRDLRMPEFGGYTIERRFVTRGVYEYRLTK